MAVPPRDTSRFASDLAKDY
ncbi:hypothetical protein CCACVL1_15350 [Corchorus capsularis]|uniref:Uncharacterized protein n=1 Tax=Corchorus capsularis TaxID=210143 RepID=A0A1R3I311_COCAP|nr:hypothetical protein CCACVL1_15350 [Corchorus capsularis]